MQTNSVNGQSGRTEKSFWTVRAWFTLLIIMLLLLAGIYLFTHLSQVHSGYQYSRFNAQQISQINKILYARDEYATEETIITGIDTVGLPADSASDTAAIKKIKERVHYITYTNRCNDSCRLNNAMLYIISEFDNKIKPDQLTVIRDYIRSFSSQEVGVYLSDLKLRVQSYFWLTGPYVYVELIFWVIAGVICSILFTLGSAIRYGGSFSDTFSPNEIPYQVAKFFYAPLCAIVFVFIYNYIKHRNVVEVNTNEGMIAFGFVAGLFSGRIMGMLEKSKDLLLPEQGILKQEQKPAVATEAAPLPVAANEPDKAEVNVTGENREASAPDFNYPFDEMEAEIPEVTVDVRLDVSGLFEEERTEIMARGFDSAVVTLHSVNGRDIFTARKLADVDPNAFIAHHIRPGIYIVRATLTQSLSNGYIINLFGEKTAYITRDNKSIELYIKKYEAID